MSNESLLYIVDPVSIYLKLNIKLPRTIWYSLERKINLLIRLIGMPVKISKCEFPGVSSPAYQYKSFCYLPVGSSRILALREVDGVKLMFDFRYLKMHLDSRGIVYFGRERNVNYGLYSKSIVLENVNTLFSELEIKYRVKNLGDEVVVEIVKTVPPEILSFFTTKILDKLKHRDKLKGKYTTYNVKIVTVSGIIMIKLVSDPIPITKAKPVIEEGKKVLKQALSSE